VARKAFFLGDTREREQWAKGADQSGYAWWIAIDYAFLGDHDKAFYWLDKAFAEGEENLMYLKVEGQVDSLRKDPRFPELLPRAGLN
jgi:hypothetical protein